MPAALFQSISFVSGHKRRDSCDLRHTFRKCAQGLVHWKRRLRRFSRNISFVSGRERRDFCGLCEQALIHDTLARAFRVRLSQKMLRPTSAASATSSNSRIELLARKKKQSAAQI